jgi:hypothetical protein
MRIYCPKGHSRQPTQVWLDALRSDGRDPDDYRLGIIKPVFVTNDRDRDWPAIRTAERFRMEYYAEAFKTAGLGVPPDQDKERINQNWLVGDVDHCVRELTAFIRDIA